MRRQVMAKIRLAEMVQELRQELTAAIAAGEGEDLRFRLGEIELEAEVVVTKEGSGKAGVKFWVMDAELGGSAEKKSVHRIKLRLEPETSRGGSVSLAGKGR